MTLVVENGTGQSTAESYISVADADAYLAKYGYASTWGVDNTAKEIALRKATRYIDAVYFERWSGDPKDADQALNWPRTSAYRNDGVLLDDSSVPIGVKNATAELAVRAVSEDILPDITTADIKSESVSVGPISKATTYLGAKSAYKTFSVIDRMLGPYFAVGAGQFRLIRG